MSNQSQAYNNMAQDISSI